MPARRKRSTGGLKTTSRPNGRTPKDAISFLKQEHTTVRGLLERLVSAAQKGRGAEQLLTEIEKELKVHTQIEEEIFYPAYKDSVKRKEELKLYYEALEEHHVVDMVLPEIKDTGENSVRFAAKAKVLKDIVEHHADEEETQMFPKARKAIGAAELRDLGVRLQERKQQLMGSTTWDRSIQIGRGAFERMLKPFAAAARAKKTTTNGKKKRAA